MKINTDSSSLEGSQIELVLEPRSSEITPGFKVRRSLPSRHRRMVGPFIFFDHMGPVEFPPGQSMEVLPHPHIGLATVTYLFSGEILHADSVGSHQAIQPGAINWMIAGAGIVHSERTSAELRRSGQTLHGIQLWVALPEEYEDCEPAFFHHPAHTLPEWTIALEASPQYPKGGNTGGPSGTRSQNNDLQGVFRLLIGKAMGRTSPVQTFSDMLYLELRLPGGAHCNIPSLAEEQAIYIVSGKVSTEGKEFEDGSMLVLKKGKEVSVDTYEASRLMILGGAPMEKRKIYWNFVHSNPERIEEAKKRWKEQTFPAIEGEKEFVPLPE